MYVCSVYKYRYSANAVMSRTWSPAVSIAGRRGSCLMAWVSFCGKGWLDVILHGLTGGGSVVCGGVLLVVSVCNGGQRLLV